MHPIANGSEEAGLLYGTYVPRKSNFVCAWKMDRH